MIVPTVYALADAASVHANTARQHLAQLESAAIVDRQPVPAAGRGRPATRYRLTKGWRLPISDFRGLAELLGALVLRMAPEPDQLQTLGRDWGRYLAGRPGAKDVVSEIPGVLQNLGFDARVADSEVILSACPCPLVAPSQPEVLCRLAVSVIEGMLAATGSVLRVVDGRHAPQRRLCAARLQATT